MKNKMKNNNLIQEEINRAKQLWGYDTSKTIFEQSTGNTGTSNTCYAITSLAPCSGGTYGGYAQSCFSVNGVPGTQGHLGTVVQIQDMIGTIQNTAPIPTTSWTLPFTQTTCPTTNTGTTGTTTGGNVINPVDGNTYPCDPSTFPNWQNWGNNWTNSGPFNNSNPNQPCNHICKKRQQWGTTLINAGPVQANQLACKLGTSLSASIQNQCTC